MNVKRKLLFCDYVNKCLGKTLKKVAKVDNKYVQISKKFQSTLLKWGNHAQHQVLLSFVFFTTTSWNIKVSWIETVLDGSGGNELGIADSHILFVFWLVPKLVASS